MSVGEWLNNVIEPSEDGEPARFADRDEPVRFTDFDDEPADEWRREPRRPSRRERVREQERDRDFRRDETALAREELRRAARAREEIREAARAREEAREAVRAREEMREAARAREEFGEVHARLDRLSGQLERITLATDAQQNAAQQRPAPQPPRQPGKNRVPPLTGTPQRPRRGTLNSTTAQPPSSGRPPVVYRPAAERPGVSVDAAVAEITERQRALYGEAPAYSEAPAAVPADMTETAPAVAKEPAAPAPAPAPATPAYDFSGIEEQLRRITVATTTPAYDLSGLEEQLRQITARIETLRPTNELATVIAGFRNDLTEISRQVTEALPRHAVESLEIEIKALAQRIDHSRQTGVDTASLVGLEQGLAEVRDALRGLTPAENLVGFDDAVRALSQKVDLMMGREDPAALQQLETAIGALRGIVSHVASNDTLTKVAEDVRSLAGKVDSFANSAASGPDLSTIENRIDTLTSALTASTEAGQAVPRELEKLLSGLIEKLEWVQLTQTDHAALAHLEDRIASLVKRFDASDARFVHLEAVERGLADLLVHIDRIRGVGATDAKSVAPDGESINRAVATIKQSERRTQDSLEAVHGTVEQVVDRLAMIESGMHHDTPVHAPPAAPMPAARQFQADAVSAAPVMPPLSSDAMPLQPADTVPPLPPASVPAYAEPAPRRAAAAARPPIDPNLPPDYPLEPGSAAGPARVPSAAERIAESEAAFGSAKPPAIPEAEAKSNFIAAARRAAQAAAASPPDRKSKAETGKPDGTASGKLSQRMRKLLMVGSVVLIAIGCLRIATHMFDDSGSAPPPAPRSENAAPPTMAPEADSAKEASPEPISPPLALPSAPGASPSDTPSVPSGDPAGAPPAAAPSIGPTGPARQSSLPSRAGQPDMAAATPPADVTPPVNGVPLWATPDITGSLSRPSAKASQSTAPVAATPDGAAAEKLPATIGGPALRAAALGGDAAAAYEVATRFADGHGVPQSNETAAHWFERAAKQGLAPAQFRLGSFYEKGVGVKKDLAAARDLYLAAANKGNGKAMHNLAVLHAEGIDGPADYRTAAHWFRKAAEHGVTDSQYNLAILYARGIGVEQNYAESYKWFVIAANNGDTEAAKKRDEVVSHLDPQSLTTANLAVQTWSPQPQPADATEIKAPAGGWDAPAAALSPAKAKPHPATAKAAVPTKID